jgi:hypothetical protein
MDESIDSGADNPYQNDSDVEKHFRTGHAAKCSKCIGNMESDI